MTIEAMKQALEALEMLARYENPETRVQVRKPKDGGPIVTMYPHKVATDAAAALRTAIEQAEKQEPVAWKNAAIRLGEELSSVGPDGYYDMTSDQWLDWALEQQPRGKNSLNTPPAAQRQWVGLTDEEYLEIIVSHKDPIEFCRDIEQRLKEKNHG
jgi:hypothetical protein